ncbi:MAG TPA: helicase, partial [Ensifer sp.]|nr:helicase [Ensifer sp.]
RRTSVLMKRLRENAMLEAEISVNGDVFVEGHHVGQLTGFRFTLATGGDGPDAKAVQGAAQKALALEFEARAARLHASGNNDLALSSDGLVRWLGDPVARLSASDHVMRPRVILLADDQLQANAREHVVARIERFVNHHIGTVLKPLDDISRAEDLEGLAKGLAFQLVENLGVLFRRDVAEEVKSLDQDGRASIRKYGVRFGAYHIFLPALLKPAPAELITLLWALKNDGLDKPGYGDLIPMLAAGRTSVVTDPSFERTFYKLAGFRFLGKRAVRIDILERLADLIRPLLQWKPGTQPRPEGAYDGRRFTATTSMLSILGATPDDMEEILKGLGYRADSVKAEEAAAFLASHGGAAADATVGSEPVAADDADADGVEEQTEAAAAAAEAPAAEAEQSVDAEAAASDEAQPAETVVAETGEPVEAKPVLLWRPGTRQDNQRQGGRPQGEQRRGGQRHGHGQNQGEGRDGGRKGGQQARGKRSDGGKPEGGPRQDRGERHDRHDRGGKQAQGKFEARPPRREKPVDPDSPFAKLAALKEQMKK